jgi:hypothetical protein
MGFRRRGLLRKVLKQTCVNLKLKVGLKHLCNFFREPIMIYANRGSFAMLCVNSDLKPRIANIVDVYWR